MSDLISIDRDTRLSDQQRIRILESGHHALVEQLAEVAVALRDVQACMQRGDTRMGAMESELSVNSTVTAEVRDILSVAKVGLRVLGGVGTLVRWVGYLSAAGAAIYSAWYMVTHGGRPPGAE